MFIYEVVCDIDTDKEVREYCLSNDIYYVKEGKVCNFISSKEKLEELHNNFFDEYEFELSEENIK